MAKKDLAFGGGCKVAIKVTETRYHNYRQAAEPNFKIGRDGDRKKDGVTRTDHSPSLTRPSFFAVFPAAQILKL